MDEVEPNLPAGTSAENPVQDWDKGKSDLGDGAMGQCAWHRTKATFSILGPYGRQKTKKQHLNFWGVM